ncbi:MAG: FecR domain-containing protein [Ginsengibacter sp.]
MEHGKAIENLFKQYVNNECSPEEVHILLQHFGIEKNNDQLRRLIHEYTENSMYEEPATNPGIENLLNTSFNKIKETILEDKTKAPLRVIRAHKRICYLVAASVCVLLSSSIAFFLFQPEKVNKVIAKQNNVRHANDIAPGRNNAILTLDNGSKIMLDSAANGTLAQQGNTDVQKMNGQIAYNKKSDNRNASPVYNTITTARGNQYQLVLSDGSKVWLNAASSIRFPASFIGSERKVEITGEAYFEVARDATKPFKVEFITQSGQKAEVQVLGTHFDVNAYWENAAIKTTLLEGIVKIKTTDQIQMLVPGQQAMLSADVITLNKDADVSQAVAWKDGFFMFNNTDLKTIMQQAARWYDVEVDYDSKIAAEGFTGKISRNVPLSEFLKLLELNDVHVKSEGRKVTITL